MCDNTTGRRVEASVRVNLIWDVEKQRWIVDTMAFATGERRGGRDG